MTILVTGATGFVGSRLCERLQNAGRQPRALVRRQSATRALEAAGHSIWLADWETGAGLEAAMEGAEAVVHCAGGGRVYRRADYWQQNTATTRRLMAAIASPTSTVKRFVLLSSLAAREPVSLYGQSKEAAEHLARNGSVATTILRPPGIYGPGDDRLLPLFRSVKRGWAAVPHRHRPVPWLHVDDCARAIIACLDQELPSGTVLEVDDGQPCSLEDMLRLMAGLMDCPPPRIVQIPAAALYSAGAVAEVSARLRRRASLFNRDKALELTRKDLAMDASLARTLLGWSPEVVLEVGLAETYGWLSAQGRLG